jgi:hypothetical protein
MYNVIISGYHTALGGVVGQHNNHIEHFLFFGK